MIIPSLIDIDPLTTNLYTISYISKQSVFQFISSNCYNNLNDGSKSMFYQFLWYNKSQKDS